MKKNLLFQAEESARLSRESKELERKLAQLEESHKYVGCVYIFNALMHVHIICERMCVLIYVRTFVATCVTL